MENETPSQYCAQMESPPSKQEVGTAHPRQHGSQHTGMKRTRGLQNFVDIFSRLFLPKSLASGKRSKKATVIDNCPESSTPAAIARREPRVAVTSLVKMSTGQRHTERVSPFSVEITAENGGHARGCREVWAPRPAPSPPPQPALECEVCWKPLPVSGRPSSTGTPRGAPFGRPVPPGPHPGPAPLPPPERLEPPNPPTSSELSLGWPQPAPTTGSLQIVPPCLDRNVLRQFGDMWNAPSRIERYQ